MDLSVRIGSLTLANPVIAASGCFGYGVEYADLVDLSSLGGVAVKGLFLAARGPSGATHRGDASRHAQRHRPAGHWRPAVRRRKAAGARAADATVIVNVCGTTIDEYAEVSRILSDADGVAAIELNISCPNIKEGGISSAAV